jgi:hypothetical protein
VSADWFVHLVLLRSFALSAPARALLRDDALFGLCRKEQGVRAQRHCGENVFYLTVSGQAALHLFILYRNKIDLSWYRCAGSSPRVLVLPTRFASFVFPSASFFLRSGPRFRALVTRVRASIEQILRAWLQIHTNVT